MPAGATPKDGPSAGVAIFVALASLLTGRRVRSEVAMTGEISLRGLVLPIGGVKEKVLAALRAGISTVILPARNRRDLEEIPADARAKLEFVWVEQVDAALATALAPAIFRLGSGDRGGRCGALQRGKLEAGWCTRMGAMRAPPTAGLLAPRLLDRLPRGIRTRALRAALTAGMLAPRISHREFVDARAGAVVRVRHARKSAS